MTESDKKPPKHGLTLSGLYDYSTALTDDTLSNGAIAINENHNEIIFKCADDWWYLEDNGKSAERTLWHEIKDRADRKLPLDDIIITFNILTGADTKLEGIDITSWSSTEKSMSVKPKADKEAYLKNESFGEF